MVSSHDYLLLVCTNSADNFLDAFFDEVAWALEVDNVPLVDAPTLLSVGKTLLLKQNWQPL